MKSRRGGKTVKYRKDKYRKDTPEPAEKIVELRLSREMIYDSEN